MIDVQSEQTNQILCELDVGANHLTDTGCRALADALTVNTTLMRLCVSHNWISLEGATALGTALARHVRCCVCFITDSTVCACILRLCLTFKTTLAVGGLTCFFCVCVCDCREGSGGLIQFGDVLSPAITIYMPLMWAIVICWAIRGVWPFAVRSNTTLASPGVCVVFHQHVFCVHIFFCVL
jgi:hypothetical protein